MISTSHPVHPRRLTLLVLLLTTWSGALRAQTRTSDPAPLVLTHVTIIDCTGAPARPNMTVVMARGRILALGPQGSVTIPSRSRVVSSSGKFLIPGLWDMHTHLAWDILKPIPRNKREDKAMEHNRDYYFPLFIVNGVLGVRDMAGVLSILQGWQHGVEQGTILGPRMVVTGQKLGMLPVVPGAPHPVTTEADVRRSVRLLKEHRADFVKLDNLRPELYSAAADEALKQGLVFVGHVNAPMGASEASGYGQRTIEHMMGVLLSASSRESKIKRALHAWRWPTWWDRLMVKVRGRRGPAEFEGQLVDSYDEAKAQALFAQFIRQGTWQVPTFRTLAEENFADDPHIDDRSWNAYFPTYMQILPRKPTGQLLIDARRFYWKQVEVAGAMRRAGVRFLAGTDTPALLSIPGFSLHDELILFVAAGFTPMEALQTATRNPAEFLGTLDSLGTIEQGKIADLVLLDANPLDDISNTRRVAAVIKGGVFIPRDSLDRMLARVAVIVKSWESAHDSLAAEGQKPRRGEKG